MSYTKTNWVNNQEPAINATNLNKIEQGIYDNDSHIGDLSNLETTAQTDVVNAINENVNNIGDLTALLTTVNTDLVNAINELENNKATKDNALQYKGYARDVSLDFNDITDSGIYYLTEDNTFSNAPARNYQWCYLIVVGFSNVTSQIIVKPVGRTISTREFSGNPGTWHDWNTIDYSDTGWIPITFDANNYFSARTNFVPKYRQIGNVVYLNGQFSIKTSLTALQNYTITGTNLPTPAYQHSFVTGAYSKVPAVGWIEDKTITFRPYEMASTDWVGFSIDGCYLTN